MTHHLELGRLGEEKACAYLVENGYRIIERNFRQHWGELDIIAISRDKTLVFIEVKTMSEKSSFGLSPEDQMSSGKLKKFRKTATLYAGTRQDLFSDQKGWRLDVLALTKIGKDFEIRHYENV